MWLLPGFAHAMRNARQQRLAPSQRCGMMQAKIELKVNRKATAWWR
jgi:hypothetical protein